jgi:hypothetical protein
VRKPLGQADGKRRLTRAPPRLVASGQLQN